MSSLGLGACLADDMGLGKTVQLLALLLAERESRAHGSAWVSSGRSSRRATGPDAARLPDVGVRQLAA